MTVNNRISRMIGSIDDAEHVNSSAMCTVGVECDSIIYLTRFIDVHVISVKQRVRLIA